jgi:hypothetical protein
MIRLIIAVVAVIAILAMAVPVVAADTTVNTGATVPATATPPLVKAKWEDSAGNGVSESGDTSHTIANFQLKPNGGFQALTDIWFWAVVTDPDQGVGNISNVYADVNYPASGADPGPNGAQKYEITMAKYGDAAAALAVFNNAYAVGPQPIVSINPATPEMSWPSGTATEVGDIRYELEEGLAYVYVGHFYMDNCELAGDYTVTIKAVNYQGGVGIWTNTMTWTELTGARYDFSGVAFGNVPLNSPNFKVIGGDKVWDNVAGTASTTNQIASIENTGNTYIKMTVKADDMQFGYNSSPAGYNVKYEARLGSDPLAFTQFDPVMQYNMPPTEPASLVATGTATVVNDETLRLCAIEKVDLGIKVFKDNLLPANSAHVGYMILGAVIAPAPPNVGTEYSYPQPPVANPPVPTPAPTR